MKRYKVKNTSRRTVERGGYTFPPLSETIVSLSKYQFRNVKAQQDLKVKLAATEPEQLEGEQPEEIVEEQSLEVTGYEVTVKDDGEAQVTDITVGDQELTPVEEAEDGEQELTPVEEEIKATVAEQPEGLQQEGFPCPYCDDYIGTSEKGLKTHISIKHPVK